MERRSLCLVCRRSRQSAGQREILRQPNSTHAQDNDITHVRHDTCAACDNDAMLASIPAPPSGHRKNEIIAPTDLPAFQTKLLGLVRRRRSATSTGAVRVTLTACVDLRNHAAANARGRRASLMYRRRFLAHFRAMDALARARQDAGAALLGRAGLLQPARATCKSRRERRSWRGMAATNSPGASRMRWRCPESGQYTAAAVLSIAYTASRTRWSTATLRACWRGLGAIRGDLQQPKRWRQLASTSAKALLPAQAAA